MNSVSMPKRPATRAWAASSATTPSVIPGIYGFALVHRPVGVGPWRRVLIGPVAVRVEEGARLILVVALAIALDADAVQQVQQPHRKARGDQQREALDAVLAEPGREADDEARGDDRDRQPGAHELHAACLSSPTLKRATSSAGVR